MQIYHSLFLHFLPSCTDIGCIKIKLVLLVSNFKCVFLSFIICDIIFSLRKVQSKHIKLEKCVLFCLFLLELNDTDDLWKFGWPASWRCCHLPCWHPMIGVSVPVLCALLLIQLPIDKLTKAPVSGSLSIVYGPDWSPRFLTSACLSLKHYSFGIWSSTCKILSLSLSFSFVSPCVSPSLSNK